MKFRQLFILLIIIFSGCSNKNNRYDTPEPFSLDYISSVIDNEGFMSYLPWNFNCIDIDFLKQATQSTLDSLNENHRIADSIITDNDIYDLLQQTLFQFSPKSNCYINLLLDRTYSSLALDINIIRDFSTDSIGNENVLFLYSQITNEPYVWSIEKLNNVRRISIQDIEDAFIKSKPLIDTSSISSLYIMDRYKAVYGRLGFQILSKPIFNQNKTFAIFSYQRYGYRRIMSFRKISDKWLLSRELSMLTS